VRALVVLLLALGALRPGSVQAVQLDELDLAPRWRLRALEIEGNEHVDAKKLHAAMVTKPRPWFALWRKYPEFDPVAFRVDLERVKRVYQNHGYFEARILHDLVLPEEGHALSAVIWIEENVPVQVGRVDVDFTGAELPPEEREKIMATLPIREGMVFTQEAYDAGLANLRGYYRQNGYARVVVRKESHVDLVEHVAAVSYRVESGPDSVFGKLGVSGNKAVSEDVVRREIAFKEGDRFRQDRLDETRDQLAALNLFSAIRLDEEENTDPEVDYHLRLTELPPREVRFGLGYDTEEQVRGLASWRHYNFLGGARQLGFAARASFISRTLLADFLQPHFPTHSTRSRLLFAETQDDEDAYTLLRTRASPRLEWQPTRRFTAYIFHRSEFDSLADVSDTIKEVVEDIAPGDAFLSGLGLGFDWIRTDDLFDPTRGFIVKMGAEPVGGIFGGDISFVRLVGDFRAYHMLVGKLLGSVRLRLGTADPVMGGKEVPIYERFYAGGINSVRGYGRWRVGPLADALAEEERQRDHIGCRKPVGAGLPPEKARVARALCDAEDEPVGGRSLVETSIELRHPITDSISGVVFFDGGQVAIDSYDFHFDDLQYGTGVGARVKTPIGPLGVDLGFPLDAPPGDPIWQVHLSLGAPF
jgi:outer membrane protein insertion porin family/translocation and assembly module TamA